VRALQARARPLRTCGEWVCPGTQSAGWADKMVTEPDMIGQAGVRRGARHHTMDFTDDARTAQRFAALARELARHPHLGPTAEKIVELAVSMLGCTGAAITQLRRDGTIDVVAASDPQVIDDAVRIADDTGQSATKAVLARRGTVVINDVRSDPRWQLYSRRITAGTSIRSIASFYLELAGVELGAISFYSSITGFFGDELLDDCAAYADHAAVALKAARAEDRSDELASALASNREIGMAIGIVMSSHSLSQDAAFDMLVVVSSHTNRKLREIAADTVRTGKVPTWESKRPPAGT
jgi:transcriptional regulator with GAF, ATPase, and Fis domain